MGKRKVLLIGWDAADWKIIGPLLAKGQMPALNRIIQNGVYGNMATMNPPYSPMLWTSVATGKTPDKHGIHGFIEVVPDLSGVRPVTANARKSRALWNIFHNQGMKSNLVGWWPSFPAEPVNGVVVSDKFQRVDPDPAKQNPMPEGTIHPESMRKEFVDLRMFPYEVTKEHIIPFIPLAARINQEKDTALQSLSRILAHNVSVHNAATKLLRTSEWDFMAVYYDMIDHFCHTFMKFYPPRLPEVPEDVYEVYKDAIIGAYRFQDMMLDRKLQLIDEDTTVIVMSDHGYEAGRNRILEMPKVQAAPAMEHREFGIFTAMGPNIKKNHKIFGVGLIDVAPTILNHFDLPLGKDMDGKIITEMFESPVPPKYIDSWEDIEGDFGELDKDQLTENFSDEETMRQLKELGYVEKLDEKKEVAILKTQCDLKHNLAKVYMGKKNYKKSRELLLELIQEKDPIDVAPYYIDLITLSIKEQNFTEAEKYLEKVRKVKSKVKYNLFFAEAEILKGTGQTAKALEIMQEVSKDRNDAQVWYKIGELQFKLTYFTDAKDSFEKAIELEPDKAIYLRALAEALIELGEYEEGLEYALTSIELVRNYPAGHFTVGRALEKLGDLENAKLAYQTAQHVSPKVHIRARIATENIELLQQLPDSDGTDKQYIKYDNQIVVVSGLPRSGTSVAMQMLEKGGCAILTDGTREADDSNPKGYYEYEPVMSIHKDNSWLDKAQNKAVKIVAPLLKHLDPQFRYKIIFMTRDLTEVIKSQQVMIGSKTDVLPLKLLKSFQKLLKTVELWQDNEPGVEILYVNYKDVLEDTEAVTEKISSFIGVKLDKDAMKEAVDKGLYRNKAVASNVN